MVNNIKWTAIDCREIESHNYRLDASAYNVDARNAEYIVSISPWKKLPLIGNGGFVEHAHYGGRLKRKYIDKYNIDSIGFLGVQKCYKLIHCLKNSCQETSLIFQT